MPPGRVGCQLGQGHHAAGVAATIARALILAPPLAILAVGPLVFHARPTPGGSHGGAAIVLFAVYTQLGLIPLAFALPPSKSSDFARRIRTAIALSLFGTFIGF